MENNFLSYVLRLLIVCWVLPVCAQQKPRMEFGMAFAGQYLNDYRGSRETQLQAYPVPYFIYRGQFLKADRDGLRAEFTDNKRWELNISAAGALNGESEDNRLRQGMPELESAAEFGPSLNINLTGEDFSEGWQLRLPLRAVFTLSGRGVHSIGYTAEPKLTYSRKFGDSGWQSKFNVGLIYGSDKYHDYYYTVDEAYATEERPLFDAAGGFSGYFTKLSLYRHRGNLLYGASLRYDNIGGTDIAESPLVETDHYFSLTFVVAKSFWQKM